MTVVDPTPLFPFGHGLSYDNATWGAVSMSAEQWDTDGTIELEVRLSNEADRPTSEVVQVYLHDVAASVVRPAQQLIAAARVDLDPGERRAVHFVAAPDLTSFTGRDLYRLVEPGSVELRVGASSADIRAVVPVELVGPVRQVGADRALEPGMAITPWA